MLFAARPGAGRDLYWIAALHAAGALGLGASILLTPVAGAAGSPWWRRSPSSPSSPTARPWPGGACARRPSGEASTRPRCMRSSPSRRSPGRRHWGSLLAWLPEDLTLRRAIVPYGILVLLGFLAQMVFAVTGLLAPAYAWIRRHGGGSPGALGIGASRPRRRSTFGPRCPACASSSRAGAWACPCSPPGPSSAATRSSGWERCSSWSRPWPVRRTCVALAGPPPAGSRRPHPMRGCRTAAKKWENSTEGRLDAEARMEGGGPTGLSRDLDRGGRCRRRGAGAAATVSASPSWRNGSDVAAMRAAERRPDRLSRSRERDSRYRAFVSRTPATASSPVPRSRPTSRVSGSRGRAPPPGREPPEGPRGHGERAAQRRLRTALRRRRLDVRRRGRPRPGRHDGARQPAQPEAGDRRGPALPGGRPTRSPAR